MVAILIREGFNHNNEALSMCLPQSSHVWFPATLFQEKKEKSNQKRNSNKLPKKIITTN